MLEEIHNFVRWITKKKRSGFIAPADITDAVNRASLDLWKELVDNARRDGTFSHLLNPFKSNTQLTASATTLSGAAEDEIIAVSFEESGAEYPARLLHSDADWSNRRNLPQQIKERYLFGREEYTVAVVDDGKKDLPADYKWHHGEVRIKTGGEYYAGPILPPDEFNQRVRSAFLAPDTNNPVATIVDDQIEFFPKPSSGTYTFELLYDKYTADKNAIVRYYQSGSDMEIVSDPALATKNVYHISKPTVATATYSESNGIPSIATTPNELDWNDAAFGDLVARTLFYLGHNIDSQEIASLERVKDITDTQNGNNGQ